ncbi:flavodoxin family protein [soil metagenome]
MAVAAKPNVERVKAAIVFETMFGTTRLLADAVARGLSVAGTGVEPTVSVRLANVNHATGLDIAGLDIAGLDIAGLDLLIVGAPTHAHGLSTPASRSEAMAWPNDPNKHVALDADALDADALDADARGIGMPGIGMHEWLVGLPAVPPYFAAFDSRWSHARILTGAASVHLSSILVSRGSWPVVPDESFLISNDQLVTGEAYRAEVWGERLLAAAVSAMNRSPLGQRDYTRPS